MTLVVLVGDFLRYPGVIRIADEIDVVRAVPLSDMCLKPDPPLIEARKTPFLRPVKKAGSEIDKMTTKPRICSVLNCQGKNLQRVSAIHGWQEAGSGSSTYPVTPEPSAVAPRFG